MVYQPGGKPISGALTGTETVVVGTAGPQITTATTQQIANLASGAGTDRQTANTNITTVGAGTLTGAAIAGGLITRSGSVAAFTDTTDTAALIVAAIPNAFVGQSFYLRIKNTVAFNETIAAGTGVTLSGSTLIPPNSVGTFLVTLTSLTAVTLLNIEVSPITTSALEVITALTTVGAGTITAAGIVGEVTARSGPVAAFTDTSDTAAAIIAAQPNCQIGQSWEWTYQNNVAFTATFANGSGVTFSGYTSAPGLTTTRFLVTYTGVGAVSIAGILQTPNVALPYAQYTTAALQSATITVAGMTGSQICNFDNTGTTPANLNVNPAAAIIAGIPNAQIGMSYTLNIRNSSGSANTATITTNTGVTLTGTMTIAQSTTRTFVVTITGAATLTIQSMGISGAGA